MMKVRTLKVKRRIFQLNTSLIFEQVTWVSLISLRISIVTFKLGGL